MSTGYNNSNNYSDIMGMEHHRSLTRRHMSMYDRAAQFAPFAALSGHGESIAETARLTDCRLEPDEDMVRVINDRLALLCGKAYSELHLSIEYFVPDKLKDGGAYVTVHGEFKRVNEYDRLIELYGGICIPIDDVYRIDGEIFG